MDKNKTRKLYFFIFLTVFVLIAGLIAGFIMNTNSELDRKFAEIRAGGYPVTLEELNNWHSIPKDAENAADKYLEASSFYINPKYPDSMPVVGNILTPKRNEKPGAETMKLIEGFLSDNDHMFKLLSEGAKIKHCRYPIDYKNIFTTIDKSCTSEFYNCAQALNLKILYESEKKFPASIVEDFKIAFSYAGSLENEPLFIYQLIRMKCLAMILNSVEYAVNRVQFDDEQLIAIAEQLTNAHNLKGLSTALVGQRSYTIGSASISDSIGAALGMSSLTMRLYSASGLKKAGLLKYLDISEECMSAVSLPLPERIDAMKVIEDKINNLPWYHRVVKINSLSFPKINKLDIRSIARIKVACTGLAVERYRLSNDRLPDNLEQLAPDFIESVPLDPFDSRPLRYKQLEKGYVVYSINTDRVDNGGKELRDGVIYNGQ